MFEGLVLVPGLSQWDEVMYTGRVCTCNHGQVCHWNGDNRQGKEAFDDTCAMCTCKEFRDSGRRRTGRPAPVAAPIDAAYEEDVDLWEEAIPA